MALALKTLAPPDAALIQHGLKALGYYDGTTKGVPGPKTEAAYSAYLNRLAPIAPSGDRVARLIEVLVNEDGVRESPKNSNRGARVQEYQAATWLSGTGWPWCAAFICWGILRLQEESALPFERPETAGAWDFERWAREQEQGVKLFKPAGTIKAGDIVIFDFSHIGLAIADESGGRVQTVEGNTDSSGSREGGGVYLKSRAKSSIRSHIRLFV